MKHPTPYARVKTSISPMHNLRSCFIVDVFECLHIAGLAFNVLSSRLAFNVLYSGLAFNVQLLLVTFLLHFTNT